MLDASNAPTNDGGPIVVHVRYSRSTCGGLLRGGRAGSTVAEETVVTAAGVAWNRGLRRRWCHGAVCRANSCLLFMVLAFSSIASAFL